VINLILLGRSLVSASPNYTTVHRKLRGTEATTGGSSILTAVISNSEAVRSFPAVARDNLTTEPNLKTMPLLTTVYRVQTYSQNSAILLPHYQSFECEHFRWSHVFEFGWHPGSSSKINQLRLKTICFWHVFTPVRPAWRPRWVGQSIKRTNSDLGKKGSSNANSQSRCRIRRRSTESLHF